MLDRGFGLAEFLNEEDPNFEYQTVFAGDSRRTSAPDEKPYITITEQRGEESAHLHAWARQEAGDLLPGWGFTDDEVGRE